MSYYMGTLDTQHEIFHYKKRPEVSDNLPYKFVVGPFKSREECERKAVCWLPLLHVWRGKTGEVIRRELATEHAING